MPFGKLGKTPERLGQRKSPPLRRSPALPLLRMFGLGIIAVIACIWALCRPKRTWELNAPVGASATTGTEEHAAPASSEIEIDTE